MEFYEHGGAAVAKLLWSGPTTPKAVVPSSALGPRLTARINFQPAGAAVPAGYLADTGAVYGLRANGERYGWNADNSAQTRDRNSASSPDQRYDTLDTPAEAGEPERVLGDRAFRTGRTPFASSRVTPSHFDGVFRTNVEGVLTVNGTPTTATRWLEGTATVTVTDGRLTITNASGRLNNKLCFVEIS